MTEYEPGASAYVGTRARAVLGRGMRATVPAATPAELATAVTTTLAGSGGELVIGALGFDPAITHLVIPDSVVRAPHIALPAATPSGTDATAWAGVSTPSETGYAAAVRTVLDAIAAGIADKVVLARALDVVAPSDIDLAAVVARLVAADPDSYAYALPLPTREPATLVGASPELLVRRTGPLVEAYPMAGSRPRMRDPAIDERAGAELAASAKERAEHAYVVAAVVDALRPHCTDVTASKPQLVRTSAVWHLATPIRGRLRGGAAGASALELALALHPTPAVCGTPRDAAHRLIAAAEGFDRGFYAGAVGWCDAAGDGEFAVAIRCALVRGRAVRAYAGAGIVAGSDPAMEVAETTAKLRTLLSAL